MEQVHDWQNEGVMDGDCDENDNDELAAQNEINMMKTD